MPRDWRRVNIQESVDRTKSDIIKEYRNLSKLANNLGLKYLRPLKESEIKSNVDMFVGVSRFCDTKVDKSLTELISSYWIA
jgi:hypothetical protein